MTTRRSFILTASSATLAMCLGIRQALAQTINKTARLVVGFPPGGSADTVARLLAERLKGQYAPSVIVDNRAGAGGRIGVENVKNSEPDGSVVLLTPASMMIIYPHVYKKLPYDPIKDLTAVAPACVVQFALSVGPMVPASVKTVDDFVRWCKANPDKAAFGSPGAGTMVHFAGMMFSKAAGIALNHVPYKGGAPVIQDVVGGQIACGFNVMSEPIPHYRAGRLRILATTGSARLSFLPEVPTLKEAGYNVDVQEYFGVFVPAKTPSAVVARLNAALRDALQSTEVTEGLGKLAFVPASPMAPDAFSAQLNADLDRWGPIVKSSGFTVDE